MIVVIFYACTRVDLHSIDVLRIYNLREDAYSGFSINITIKAEAGRRREHLRVGAKVFWDFCVGLCRESEAPSRSEPR